MALPDGFWQHLFTGLIDIVDNMKFFTHLLDETRPHEMLGQFSSFPCESQNLALLDKLSQLVFQKSDLRSKPKQFFMIKYCQF